MPDAQRAKRLIYDVVMNDQYRSNRSEGGRASFAGGPSIYVGNYANWKTELDRGHGVDRAHAYNS